MSTPAIITKKDSPSLELYIHYDGDDKDMIQEIVDVAYKNNARNVNRDEYYGMARGIAPYGKEDYDYHYVIDENWNVVCVEDHNKELVA